MFRLHNLNKRRAFTMIETIFSVALLVILSGVVVMGMILHSRMAKGNIELQRMAENSRNLVDMAQIEALDATSIGLSAGPSGPNTVLTLGKPDPTNPSNTIFTQFTYYDADGSTTTIEDNVVLMRRTNTPNATTGKRMVWYVTPDPKGFFQRDFTAGKFLVNILGRVGDRTFPANNNDNRFTGIGNQSYTINASISAL